MFEERRKKGCRSLALSPVSLSRTRTHKHMRSARTAHTPHEQGRVERPGPSNILSSSCGSGHCLDPCLSLSLSHSSLYMHMHGYLCRSSAGWWCGCSAVVCLPPVCVLAVARPACCKDPSWREERKKMHAMAAAAARRRKEREREALPSFLPSIALALAYY